MKQNKKITQADLAKACGIDQGSVSRILNNDLRDSFSKETVEKVYQIARELGYAHPSIVSPNRRISKRQKVSISCDFQILVDGKVWDSGKCLVNEVSESGLVLGGFRSKKNSFPMSRFTIRCNYEGNSSIFAVPVRFTMASNEMRLCVRIIDK